PTNVCNHNCYYCAYRSGNLQLGKDMEIKDFIPEAKMMELIDDWEEMGVKAITFSGGGEPFCYPYLLKAVKKLSQTPIKFATLTNGSRLNGELAELFAFHGTWLRVSVDGWDDAGYSRYRQVPEGEFTKVMKNMADFKKLNGDCFLGVSVVVDDKNAPHIYELVKRIKDIGVDSVKVSSCIVSNVGAENNRYHAPFFKSVKEAIEKAKQEFESENFIIFDAHHELEDKFEKHYSWCPYLQILPVIGADLNVYSCQDKAYNLEEGLIGSIRDIRFKD
ncbi:MAG: radical SAM protein, partial [bacterium]|nr:radical SAM protein [bacterium]